MIAPLRQASPDIVEHDLMGYLCDRCLIATVSRVRGDIARGAAMPRSYDLAYDAHQCSHVVSDDGVGYEAFGWKPITGGDHVTIFIARTRCLGRVLIILLQPLPPTSVKFFVADAKGFLERLIIKFDPRSRRIPYRSRKAPEAIKPTLRLDNICH